MQRSSDAHRRERGFTLVELVVSLAILALVFGLLASGSQVLRSTGERIGEQSRGLVDLALTTDLLHQRLGDAVAVGFGRPGENFASFDGDRERARFLTLALDVEARGPLLAMEFGSAEALSAASGDEPDGGLRLVLAELAPKADDFAVLDDGSRTEIRHFAPDVTDVTLSYFGRQEGAEAPGWYPVWREQPRLPRAVRLELEQRGQALPPLIVPIRQALPPRCPVPEADVLCPAP